jgi:hypothetical protein
MDPDANLKELLSLAEDMIELNDAGDQTFLEEVEPQDVARLAELVIALDGWIRGGGFLPASWKRT